MAGGESSVTAPSAPVSSPSRGTAWRRRQQADRAQFRHLQRSLRLVAAAASHHTAAPVPEARSGHAEPSSAQSDEVARDIAVLRAEVAGLRLQVAALTAQHHASDCSAPMSVRIGARSCSSSSSEREVATPPEYAGLLYEHVPTLGAELSPSEPESQDDSTPSSDSEAAGPPTLAGLIAGRVCRESAKNRLRRFCATLVPPMRTADVFFQRGCGEFVGSARPFVTWRNCDVLMPLDNIVEPHVHSDVMSLLPLELRELLWTEVEWRCAPTRADPAPGSSMVDTSLSLAALGIDFAKPYFHLASFPSKRRVRKAISQNGLDISMPELKAHVRKS